MCHKISKAQLWLFQESIAPAGCSVSSAVRQPGTGCPSGWVTILFGTAVLQLSLQGGPTSAWWTGSQSFDYQGLNAISSSSELTTPASKKFMRTRNISLLSVQFSSVWDPMDCSMPRQLPEFTQTHVHRVCGVIQPSHFLLSPSPPTFNLFQHQGLFQGVSSSHQMAKILEF